MQYNTEGITFSFASVDDKIIRVTPPTFVVLTVAQTDPSSAGDTVKNAMKDAEMETGLKIKVPLFVNNGDKIRVDTRDGSYVERA
jgi:elongation factor P